MNSSQTRINWEPWIREIRDIGKTNPLTNFEFNDFGQIDFERAHPSGIAQFITNGSVLLSNLIREPLAFSRALSTAKRIKAKAGVHLKDYGIHTTYLTGGLVSLQQSGFDYSLPVVLWPLDVLRKTDDFEITRSGTPFVNPALVEVLFHTYGASIDTSAVLELLENSIDLLPVSVLEYVASKLANNNQAQIRSTLILGNFAIEPSLIEQDIRPEGNLLLRQLAEVSEVPSPSTTQLAEPRLVADADATQKRIVARAVRGDNFAVETLPGSGYSQTVVNVLSALVHEGKKVLVVTPRRQTLTELSERFASLNLSGLMVRSSNLWLDMVGAIARFEKAQPSDLVAAGVRSETAHKNLEEYLDLLKRPSESLHLSPLQVLEKLAELAAMPNAPTCAAKISFNTLLSTRESGFALELLSEAFDAGLFKFSPDETPWYGVDANSQTVTELVELANRLHGSDYAAVDKQVTDLVFQANFKTPENLIQVGEYLALFVGVASTLDRFVPEIYDRDLTELIAATGPRKFGGSVAGSDRRRLKKLAKEYVRSGVSISDLNAALKTVQAQKEAWVQFVNDDSLPTLISGANDALVIYRTFVEEVKRLEQKLDKPLLALSLNDLKTSFQRLVETTDALENLDEINLVREKLATAGLQDVATEFARIHVSKEHIPAEFDQVWWQSAFEITLMGNPSLAEYSKSRITDLEQDFLASQRALIQGGASALNTLQSEKWRAFLQAKPEQASALKEILKSRTATVRGIWNFAPDTFDSLLSSLAVSPYEIAGLFSSGQKFDTVLVLDAAGTTVGENISALTRVEQVIAFGDSAIAAPVGFEIEASEIPAKLESTSPSIFEVIARVFGVESMRKNWRQTGQTLCTLINKEFYQNRIIFEPTASEYLGKSNFELRVVKSVNAAETDIYAESPEAEVQETVNEALRHASTQPESSLLLVTASDVHAARVQGELDRQLLNLPDLKNFFDSHGDEKFEIATLKQLSHRVADRVIFSPGFGLTSTGLAHKDLGQLSESSGRRTLANMLVSARRALTVITAIPADKFPEQLDGAAKQFSKLYRFAASQMPVDSEIDSDPMLSDLALRLRKLGAHVTIGYTNRIPMVVSFGVTSAVIVPDWNLVGDDLDEKIRLRPALLEAMGWKVVRIHALEVFSDPQALAVQIADEVGLGASKKSQLLFDEPTFDETDVAWGDSKLSNDQNLRENKPPHWG